MTPPTLRIGDRVEIIGLSEVGSSVSMGEKFTISEILKRADSEAYSDADHSWYPASSLRLVEELKIGDWVEVVGPSKFGNCSQSGRIFQIQHINKDGEIGLDDGDWLFLPASLRKLTPDEVEQHTGTFEYAMKKCQSDIEETTEAVRNLLERLSAIEKNISDINGRIDAGVGWEIKFNERQSVMQKNIDALGREIKGRTFDKTPIAEILKRLDFLEAFQKDEAIDSNPSDGMIRIRIYRGTKEARKCAKTDAEIVDFVRWALDSMKKED